MLSLSLTCLTLANSTWWDRMPGRQPTGSSRLMFTSPQVGSLPPQILKPAPSRKRAHGYCPVNPPWGHSPCSMQEASPQPPLPPLSSANPDTSTGRALELPIFEGALDCPGASWTGLPQLWICSLTPKDCPLCQCCSFSPPDKGRALQNLLQ